MIWYFPLAFPGLRRMQISRSAMNMIAQVVVPPSIKEAIESGKFSA